LFLRPAVRCHPAGNAAGGAGSLSRSRLLPGPRASSHSPP
jgi:hypothetical protein